MSIRVYTAEELLAAVKADATKVLLIEKKKDEKVYKGTRFLNTSVVIGADAKKDGWISFENVMLKDGMADPANLKDPRNQYEGTRMQLGTSVSESGTLGEALVLLNPAWKQKIAELSAGGFIKIEGKKVHELVNNKLSDDNAKNPGGIIEDGRISFKVDFEPYSQLHPTKILRGLPKTQFYDYNKSYKDERDVVQYHPATVEDPISKLQVPVDKSNIHLFVTERSIIRKGRLSLPGVAISQAWVSLPLLAGKIVLEQGAPEGFSDEVPVDAAAVVRNLFAQVDIAPVVEPAPTVPVVAGVDISEPKVAEPTADEVAAMAAINAALDCL